MGVQLHYGGKYWDLETGTKLADCQRQVMDLCRMGGGVAEFDAVGSVKVAVLIAPSIPIAFLEL